MGYRVQCLTKLGDANINKHNYTRGESGFQVCKSNFPLTYDYSIVLLVHCSSLGLAKNRNFKNCIQLSYEVERSVCSAVPACVISGKLT